MANLYQLALEIENFELEIDEETGEVTNLDELDALEMERDTKIENIALWIKDLNADAAAIKAEAQALTKRQKTAEKKAESLKRYLVDALAGQKFSTPKVALSYRHSKAVDITDETIIPGDYLTLKTEVTANKKKIKEAIEAGEIVPGAYLVDRTSLQIK